MQKKTILSSAEIENGGEFIKGVVDSCEELWKACLIDSTSDERLLQALALYDNDFVSIHLPANLEEDDIELIRRLVNRIFDHLDEDNFGVQEWTTEGAVSGDEHESTLNEGPPFPNNWDELVVTYCRALESQGKSEELAQVVLTMDRDHVDPKGWYRDRFLNGLEV
ncbi:MAG: hypothetical protein AAFX06_32815 [Planctomycetota bacterium]